MFLVGCQTRLPFRCRISTIGCWSGFFIAELQFIFHFCFCFIFQFLSRNHRIDVDMDARKITGKCWTTKWRLIIDSIKKVKWPTVSKIWLKLIFDRNVLVFRFAMKIFIMCQCYNWCISSLHFEIKLLSDRFICIHISSVEVLLVGHWVLELTVPSTPFSCMVAETIRRSLFF